MKKSIKLFSFLMCLTLLLSMTPSLVVAAPTGITGAEKVTTQDIMIGSTDTGLDLTQMILTSGTTYAKSTTGLLNVIEIPAKTENITMAVLNGGKYNWSQATMGTSAVKYNEAHSDGTIIAAVNGDPWLMYHTDYDGDGVGATGPSVKKVSVSRGLQIVDGEIWATRQLDDENNLHKAEERGTSASHGPTFGILPDGTYIIGKPIININLKNTTKGSTAIKVDGINRLAAPNSLIIYNQRCGTESFAYADAYEVYVQCKNTAFNLNTAVTGTVTALYSSQDTSTRPAIDASTIVLSARGSAISRLQGKFAVGDSVYVDCTFFTDNMDKKQKNWADVTGAISGFFTLLEKGVETGQASNTTKYPCSIIALKQDGTAVMVTTTPNADGTRASIRMMDLPDMLKELGVYTAILFDGGGSTSMITLSGSNYVRRSSAVDGTNSVRGVINGLAIVYQGKDLTIQNKETNNIARLPDMGVIPPDETPDVPVDDNADLTCAPSYAYKYMASVDEINGVAQNLLQGMRDPAYSTSWTTEQKLASIKPGVVSGITVKENNTITLKGWAIVNGGQEHHYYSVDKQNWYRCEATMAAAEDAVIESATIHGNVTAPHAENGRFTDLTVDLSGHKGETVDVYVAVEAGSTGKLCHYLTMTGVSVPADPEVDTNAPEADTGVTDTETQAQETEATIDTEAEVETSVEADTSAEVTEGATQSQATDTPPQDDGCGASVTVAGGSLLVLIMSGASLLLRKKKDE